MLIVSPSILSLTEMLTFTFCILDWFQRIRKHPSALPYGHRTSQMTTGRMKCKLPLVDVGIAFALIVGNLVVIAAYLRTDLSSQTWNNEYIQIAVARVFRDHAWTWNPLQYAGAPLSYAYPPLFNTLLFLTPAHSLGRAYHVVTGLGYALVPVSLYLLSLQLFRSRPIAALAAASYSIFPSPVYYLLPPWGSLAARFQHAPWPFVALVGYNEVAHIISLAPMLLAVTLAWQDRWKAASAAGQQCCYFTGLARSA